MTGRRKLVAFDLDGTLLDSIPSIVVGVTACWEALGFPPAPPEAIRQIIGLPWERGVEMLIPGGGAREVEMIRQYQAEVGRGERPRPARPPERLFPGVDDLLDRLAADGYGFALVTSRSGRRIDQLIAQAGLGNRFLSVQTADCGPGKPDPFLLLQAMREVGADARDTVMIGDTTYDVETARNAGTGAVGVVWGVHDASELRASGAHHVARRLEDLPGLVAALAGAAHRK